MNTISNRIGMFVAGALALGAIAYGQSTVMTANVPFAFRTANTTLPAGSYMLTEEKIGGVVSVRFWNEATKQSVLTSAGPMDVYNTGKAELQFRCAGDVCALSGIRNSRGSVSYSVPTETSRHSHIASVAIVAAPAGE